MTRHLSITADGTFTDAQAPSPHADKWVKDGAHWANEGHAGWYAWQGCAGYYARLRLSSPPLVAGPRDRLTDLSLAIDAGAWQ